ncbi:glycosyltransferase family 2 protein [Leifsonia sp. NPDC058194]|uniref:glycosyltransferase family 2 protein n=1 Tax=Leifsonia sp. NPDC058194 TaxID=3346374 RepID=UPI0036DF7CFD
MNATLPRVTVVVPCYNYGHYLPAAVRSALEQPGVEVDVIIVDDASPDGSVAVARALASRDPRVRVIEHEQNRGHIRTYNDGLAEATGEYVVLLSADDLLAPGSLGRSTALMRRHPSVGLVYGYAPEFSDAPPPPSRSRAREQVWKGDRWLQRICDRGTNLIVNPEAILRRDVMDRLVGYAPDLPQTADMELWMRAAAISDVGRVAGPYQGFYRVHDANMHLTDYRGLLTEIRARRDTFTAFFAGPGSGLPRAVERRDAAHRTLAREAVRLERVARNGDGGLAPELADEFSAFAVETWPGITGTRLWRQTATRRHRPAGALRRTVESRVTEVTGALRWRRWRRYGV